MKAAKQGTDYVHVQPDLNCVTRMLYEATDLQHPSATHVVPKGPHPYHTFQLPICILQAIGCQLPSEQPSSVPLPLHLARHHTSNDPAHNELHNRKAKGQTLRPSVVQEAVPWTCHTRAHVSQARRGPLPRIAPGSTSISTASKTQGRQITSSQNTKDTPKQLYPAQDRPFPVSLNHERLEPSHRLPAQLLQQPSEVCTQLAGSWEAHVPGHTHTLPEVPCSRQHRGHCQSGCG